MLYVQTLTARQKMSTLGRFLVASLKEFWEALVSWTRDPWIGSQRELAEKQRYDALEQKDREIRGLKERLGRERALTAELSDNITSMGLRLVEAECQLNGKDVELDHLRADVAALQAERNEMLGGRKRKRP